MRIGHGYDVHAFGPGDHVMLGGVRIEYGRGLVAHSDGDVVIHALCDALLGAAGLGDIGRLFPDDDSANADADSTRFLNAVMARLDAAGLHVVNADITVIAEAPRLSAHIETMCKKLASALRVARGKVNVKATTNEGLGALGRAQGIAAHAVTLLAEGS